jgi:hypothetical protein
MQGDTTVNVCGKNLISALVCVVLSMTFQPSVSFGAGELAQNFTYQGRLLNAAGTMPITDAQIDYLRFDILAPNNCILYSEDYTNVALSSGVFSVKIGTGTRTAAGQDPGLTLTQVFDNMTPSPAVAGATRAAVGGNTTFGGALVDVPICAAGYTTAAGDTRILRVIVETVSLGRIMLTPNQVIGPVPQALVAESLQGFKAADLIQVTGAGVSDISQANILKLVNGTDISALGTPLHNHDTAYLKSGSDVDVSGGHDLYGDRAGIGTGVGDASQPAGVEVFVRHTDPTIRLGSIAGGGDTMGLEFYDVTGAAMRGRIEAGRGTNALNFYTDGTATQQLILNSGGASFNKTVQVGKYTNATQGDNATAGTLEYALDGSPGATLRAASAGYIWMNTQTNKLRYWSGALGTGSNIADETWVTGNFVDFTNNQTAAGNKTWSGNSTFTGTATVSNTVLIDNAGAANDLRFRENSGNGANYVGFKAPASIAADKIWILPNADGAANAVLSTDGAGNLGWTTSASALLPVVDSTTVVKGSADGTKLLRFEVDGFTTATTRVATMPDADITVAGTNIAQTFSAQQGFSANVLIDNGGAATDLRFRENSGNGANYVGFKAPASIAADKIWVLPNADGAANAVLSTDGAGNLGWTTSAATLLPVVDTTTIVKGSADATKLVRIEADGLTTGTTRVATMPDADITLAGTNIAQTFSAQQGFSANVLIDNTGAATDLRFREDSGNGANYVGFKAPAALAADSTYTLPTAVPGANGYVLSSTTAGVMSWADPAGFADNLGNHTATTDLDMATHNIIRAPALTGSAVASGTLTLAGTSHATKGYIIMNNGGGNVGIGNATPSDLLSVYTTKVNTGTATPDSVDLGGTYSTTAGTNLKLKVFDDGANIAGLGISAGQMDYKVWSAGHHVFYQGTTPLMIIKGDGNVGIGTTVATTTTKLTIQPVAYTVATDGIKFLSSDNTTHSIIQPIKTVAGAMNLWMGSNTYVDTGGSTPRYDATVASAFVNVRSSDGTIRFGTSGTGANPSEKLLIDSLGASSFTGQAVSLRPADNADNAVVNWNSGNNQILADDSTDANIHFNNSKDGGTYTLVLTNAASRNFQFTDDTAAGCSTFKYSPARGNTVAATHSVYTILRMNTTCYISWITGFQ